MTNRSNYFDFGQYGIMFRCVNLILLGTMTSAVAWLPGCRSHRTRIITTRGSVLEALSDNIVVSLHGENACFLPLKQLDQDYNAPRIVQIAGAYPGLSRSEFFAVQSEPPAETGQWTYDFSDPNGPQLGTVAIEGTTEVVACKDPVAVIAEHTSLGVPLPPEIKQAVDLLVLVDRAKTGFVERKFLLLDSPGVGLTIGAYPTKIDLPESSEILGHVVLVQIPWLPSMTPTKTGFMEADEYF